MKKLLSITIALTVFAIITQSCATSNNLNKFTGTWRRINNPEKRDTGTIKRENKAIVGTLGKDTCIGIYDKKSNVVKFYVMGQAGIVTYDKKTGHILFNKGEDGEFERIK
jgi:hypothetical protein